MEFDRNKEKTIEELLGEELEKAFKDPGADLSFLEEFDPDPERQVPTAAAIAAKADRKRKTRYMKVASWVILLGICGVAVFQGISTENPPIAGDENAYEQMEDKGNGIYMSGEAVDAEDFVVRRVIKDEALLENAGGLMDGLVAPTYIPEGYAFESLEVKTFETGYQVVQYQYKDLSNRILCIVQERTADIDGFKVQLETEARIDIQGYGAFFSRDVLTELETLRIFLDEREVISISGDVDKDILLRIAEGLL